MTTRTVVSEVVVGEIMRVEKPGYRFGRKASQDIALNPCKCLVCGQVLDMLTYPHSERHGYADKYEMIRKGLVVPLGTKQNL